MKFITHSSSNIFGVQMTRYADEKLTRPIVKHHLDGDDVQVKAEAETVGSKVELKVSVFIPGKDTIVFSVTEEQINAAIDVAADKLERRLRSSKSKRANHRDHVQANFEDYTEEFGEDDYLTDGEEDVLREMGALDDILGL